MLHMFLNFGEFTLNIQISLKKKEQRHNNLCPHYYRQQFLAESLKVLGLLGFCAQNMISPVVVPGSILINGWQDWKLLPETHGDVEEREKTYPNRTTLRIKKQKKDDWKERTQGQNDH